MSAAATEAEQEPAAEELAEEEQAPTPEEPAAEEPEQPAAPWAWDGSAVALATAPWWSAVPEADRAQVQSTLAAREEKAQTEKAFWDKLLSEDDRTAALATEAETLRVALAAAQTEAQAAKAEAQTAREASAAVAAAAKEAAAQAKAEQQVAAWEAVYPDICGAPGGEPSDAYVEFVGLVARGVPEERAAKMARALLPTVDDDVPFQVSAMRPGKGEPVQDPPVRTPTGRMSFADAKAAGRKAAGG